MTALPGKGEGLSECLMLTPETGSMTKELLFFSFLNILFLFLIESCRTPEMTTTASPLALKLVTLVMQGNQLGLPVYS